MSHSFRIWFFVAHALVRAASRLISTLRRSRSLSLVEQAFKPATSSFVPTFSSSVARHGACPLISTLRRSRRLIATPLALALIATASQTKTWQESDYSDFEKGTLRNLSLRSDGLLSLAPQFHEVFDSSSAYL